MGNHLDLPLGSVAEHQREMPSTLTFKGKLGGSSFLRTLHYLHSEHGAVVVKVYTIRREDRDRDRGSPKAVLAAQEELETIALRLEDAPFSHVCLYRHFELTPTIAYFIRPLIHTSLHERVTLRPFLSLADKLWIVFQLILAVNLVHQSGVRHGDIKMENVLLTSWNWLLLSDFAPYKPVYIDMTKTVDFTYYFDTGGRRTCCLAPERFQAPASLNLNLKHAELTPAMDVFAVGCTIAQLLTDAPLFSYADMLELRRTSVLNEDVTERFTHFSRVHSSLADMVKHMTQLDATQRWSMNAYLHEWPVPVFPAMFPALHSALAPMLPLDGDHRVLLLQDSFAALVRMLRAPDAPVSAADCEAGTTVRSDGDSSEHGDREDAPSKAAGPSDETQGTVDTTRTDEKPEDSPPGTSELVAITQARNAVSRDSFNAVFTELENCEEQSPNLTLLAVLLCAALRGAATQECRWVTLHMLLMIGPLCDDDCKLQRIVPYLLAFVVDNTPSMRNNLSQSDSDAVARALVLRHIVKLLSLLKALPRSDRGLFVEYLLPAMSTLPQRGDEMKCEYTRCLPVLACSALKLHESALQEALKDPTAASLQGPDSLAAILQDEMRRLRVGMQAIAHDQFLPERTHDGWIALLDNAAHLAAFFGPSVTSNVFVPSMLWLPNEPSWVIRSAFYRCLPDLAFHVGSFTMVKVFFPVIEATLLKEKHPGVIVHGIQALTTILTSHMVTPATLLTPNTIVTYALRNLTHYSAAVRSAALNFLAASAQLLDIPDLYALLQPAVQLALGDTGHAYQLSPMVYSQPTVVAEHLKYMRMDAPAPSTTFPESRIAKALQTVLRPSQTSLDRHAAANDTTSWPPCSATGLTRLIAPALDPVLYTSCSLHTLALDCAGIVRPCDNADPERNLRLAPALSNGADNGPRDRAAIPPQTVQATLTERLIQNSQIRSDVSAQQPSGHSVREHTLSDLHDFRPRGVLVAHMSEHQHCVNRLAVCETSHFFASASSDGTVKLWDRVRFDKIASFQSRLTYSGHSSGVTDVAFISNERIASVDSTGHLHIWDVTHHKTSNSRPTLAFTPLTPQCSYLECGQIRRLQKWGPLLLLLSERDGVTAYDERASRHVWQMPVQASHGVCLSMAAHSGSSAMCTATSRGCMHLWDLRFQVQVDSWWHSRHEPIYALAFPTASPKAAGIRSYNGSAPLIYVSAGQNEISCWDLEDFKCRQVIVAGERQSQVSTPGQRSQAPATSASSSAAGSTCDTPASRLPEPTIGARSLIPLPSGALLAAGTDKCIRYWRVNAPDNSFIVCGPLQSGFSNTAGGVSDVPLWDSAVNYVHQMKGDVGVLTENHKPVTRTARTPAQERPAAEDRAQQRVESLCHRDCIQDIAIADTHDPVLLSASRDGIIKAWR